MSELRLPGGLRSAVIEWQASTIADPIQKLRFLRCKARIRRRHVPLRKIVLAVLLCSGTALVPTVRTGTDHPKESVVADFDPKPVLPPAVLRPGAHVWRVEETGQQEVFSNGLHVDNRFAARNCARVYSIFPSDRAWEGVPELHSEPSGIVFHTTEGEQIPFEASRTSDLRHVVKETLEHTRRNRSYHFVIDKFGRVFRLVPESDVAYHAGKSVWADEKGIYLSLNDSFLGVAFEAQTRDIADGIYLTTAQIASGKLLVQMLLDKYRFPVSNCVTHCQVSVNPDNMMIGNHTDGAGDFPFEELGLPDNYALVLPSVYLLGFDYDLLFLKATGFRLWKGLMHSDERVREGAIESGLPIRQYKAILRGQYRRIAEVVERQHQLQEKDL